MSSSSSSTPSSPTSMNPLNAANIAANFLFDAEAPPPAQQHGSSVFRSKEKILQPPHIDERFGAYLPTHVPRGRQGMDKRVLLKWGLGLLMIFSGVALISIFIHGSTRKVVNDDSPAATTTTTIVNQIPTAAPAAPVVFTDDTIPSAVPTVFAPIPGDAPSPMADPTAKFIDEFEHGKPKENNNNNESTPILTVPPRPDYSEEPSMAPTFTQVPTSTATTTSNTDGMLNETTPNVTNSSSIAEGAPEIPQYTEFPSMAPSLPPTIDLSVREWTITATIQLREDDDDYSHSLALNGDGSVLVIGMPERNGQHGKVSVYQRQAVDSVVYSKLEGTTNALDGTSSSQLGMSVDVSNDGMTVALGASMHSDGAGQVQALQYSSEQWLPLGDAFPGTPGANLGFSVAMSSDGQTVAMASPSYGGDDRGRVQVLKYGETDKTWTLMGNIFEGSNAQSIYAVALSGDATRVAMALYSETYKDVTVKIHEYVDDTWKAMDAAALTAQGSPPPNAVGKWLAMSTDGSTVAFGINQGDTDDINTEKSFVKVYRATGTAQKWFELGQAIDSPEGHGIVSLDVSFDGNLLAFGANDPGDNDRGHIQVYQYSTFWFKLGEELVGTVVALAVNLENHQIILAAGDADTGVVHIQEHKEPGTSSS